MSEWRGFLAGSACRRGKVGQGQLREERKVEENPASGISLGLDGWERRLGNMMTDRTDYVKMEFIDAIY